jgi:acetamidase/formamidase
MLGDIHAAQGHGEIIGGAIETSGTIDCTITLIKRNPLCAPRFADDTQLAAVGLADDLRDAVARAYAHLLDWIVAEYQLNRWDAYNLISQRGSIVIGNLGLPPYPVAACIEREHLPRR